MTEKKRLPTAFRSIVIRTTAFAFVLWFCAMFLLTWAVAADMDIQIENSAREYMRGIHDRESLFNDESPATMPGDMEVNTLHSMPFLYDFINIDPLMPIVGRQTPSSYGSDDWFWGDWDILYGFEPAIIYYDEKDNIYAKTGSFFTFEYGFSSSDTTPPGRAYIDMDAVDGALDDRLGDRGIFYDPFYEFLRLEGYFRGNAFVPVTIDHKFNYSDEWYNVLSLTDDGNTPMKTIYGRNVKTFYYEKIPVSVKGKNFDSLVDLLVESHQSDELYTKTNLFDTVRIFHSQPKSDVYGNYAYSIALRYHPVQYSMLRLWLVYLVSAVFFGVFVVWYLLRLKKSLIDPVRWLSTALERGYNVRPTSKWQEIYALESHFVASRTFATEANSQIQQLRTALSFARNAEENRRQLISDITHELKTPLAVIHSYAECLQMRMAPEKWEQYLSVILDETKHMDAMVLQMLDLSRLEAGKVRLTPDTFSLDQLTRQVFERFSIMVEEKQLRIYWGNTSEVLITADEGRITQAVTNLVSNAVKYTPPGGEVTVKIFAKDRTVHFYIGNTSKPLSKEALDKVWDSFYRADHSRTEPGTGLGLALVKSIIQLHGGECFVRNTSVRMEDRTESGVEFGFTIPIP